MCPQHFQSLEFVDTCAADDSQGFHTHRST
jgi:hypothetical protein